MKTPREILLAQHRAAGPKLDAIRQTVVAASRPSAAINNPTEQPSPATTTVFQTLWRELVSPSRRTWTGLAAAWALLLIVNLTLRDQSPTIVIKPMTASAMISYGEQQKLLNELFADRSPAADVDRPKSYSPKPRTEKFQFLTA